MRLIGVLLWLVGLIAANASAADAAGPAYRIVPLKAAAALGNFVPLALSDSGVVTGTLYPSTGGSLAVQTDGRQVSTADYCGTSGAADNTAVISVSAYSTRQFILGACGAVGYFLRDAAAGTTTVPQPPPNAWAVQFSGVSGDGTLIGSCCAGGLGANGFVVNGSSYSIFGPTVRSPGIGYKDTYWYGLQDTCLGTTFIRSPRLSETVNFTVLQNLPFYTYPVQANAGGEVIGSYFADCGAFFVPPMPFFWRSGFSGKGQFLFPPGALNITPTQLVALNERGLVAGNSIAGSGQPDAFVWQPRTGQVILLMPPAGASSLSVVAMNNHGTVAGSYAKGGSIVPFIARCEGAGCP